MSSERSIALDVLVLGAGAAGLMCAFEAGGRGRRVLVVDHADRVGKKILISGGGRANFTNLGCRAENFLGENPRFAASALARFTPADMVALVEKHGVRFHEKTLGQLFCDTSARELVALLERECADAKVRIETGVTVGAVKRSTADGPGFVVETSMGSLACRSLVVATGGLSIPQMGATGLGYDLARQFGLRVTDCRPALVPFTLGPEDRERWCDLSGVSAEVDGVAEPAAKAPRRGPGSQPPRFREKLLLTHRGLSGPAVLQVSSYWQPGAAVEFDLAPDRDVLRPLRASKARRDPAAALAALRGVLPSRWAERWLAVNVPAQTQELSNRALDDLERSLHRWRLTPAGTEGYTKAEVTAGGVDTAALDARTLEARAVPGLYFIGEVVDITGWLGGYNFQWAWASAVAAGRSL